MRMPEERGARCGGGQRATPDPLAVAAEDRHTERCENEGQSGRMKRWDGSPGEIDEVADP
jgi:hypothetical protein